MPEASATAPRFVVVAVDCFERPLRYRLPFRFGAATLTSGVQAFVRARIRTSDGRESVGATAELMVPKWFDKDPSRTNEENVQTLRSSLALAADAYTSDRTPRSAFGHFAAHARACREQGERLGMAALAASFGAAEIDRAVLDALCRHTQRSVFEAVAEDLIGFDPRVIAPDLATFDAQAYVGSLAPRARIAVRHTVGLLDALTGSPARASDGLPESLEQAIERYGLRWFKLKLAGDARADLERLGAIAAVLDRLPDYRVTLDGNEQFASTEAVDALCHGMRAEPALRRLFAAVAYLEQPLPRQSTFEHDVHATARAVPLLIDEADGLLDAFAQARARGYSGVSSKSCKGLYKSLINAARCAMWNRDGQGAGRYFVAAEDLTAPAGLAVQQDTALAALLGLAHAERNGHHYIDGMASAPAEEQRAFLAAHGSFYEAAHGTVRLAIRAGELAVVDLALPGFASGAVPLFDTLTPMARTPAPAH
jgi:hypothetical protein